MRFLLLAVLLVGCKKDPGPSCDKITDHMLDLTKQAMPGHDPSLLGDRKAMIAQCEKRNLTADQRNCLMKATSLGELGACNPKKPAAPPTPAPTAPPSTAPSGSGSTPSTSP